MNTERYKEEALKFNFELIGKASNNNPNYRQYKCSDNHIADYQVQHMRRGHTTCAECYEQDISNKAESIGYTLIGKSDKGSYFRTFKKDCGCIDDIRISSLYKTKDKRQTGQITCKLCYRSNLEKSAGESGITLLEDIDIYNVRIKFNSCGHYKDAKKSQVQRKNLECKECWTEQLKKEAAEDGLVYVRYLSDRKHSYILPCGCSKELEPCDVRRGSWICAEHSITHYSKPCDMYLNIGFSDGLQFIKVGIAQDVNTRVKGYGSKFNWANMSCVGFDTKIEALKYEKEFHRKFKHLRLDVDRMRNLLVSGFTECYPMDAYQEINQYFSELIKKFGYSIRFRNKDNYD